MQVSVEKTGDLERRMTVQVPASSIDSKVSGRLDELRRQVRLKGFRPGRVPINIIRKRYGEQVHEEILQEVMQSSLQEAIGAQELRVAGVQRIEPQPRQGEGDFQFTAELEVFPEMPDIDVSDLQIERPEVEVGEEDVDEMIETLREQRREWDEVTREAREGDRVRLGYVAELDGERVPEAGEHEIAPVLGRISAFPQLEDVLRGVSAGEQKEVELSFPDSYRHAGLAGRTAPVKLRIKAVEESELPEVDAAFAESFGIDGGVEQLRADVRKNLEREMRQVVVSRLKQAVTEALAERHGQLAVPASAVTEEIEVMREQIRQNSGQSPPADQLRAGAEKRVRLGLLLAEIARQQKITIDPARVQTRIEELAETYDRPEQIIELYRSEPAMLDRIENMVLEEQVIDWVLENAAVSNKPMSFSELMGQA